MFHELKDPSLLVTYRIKLDAIVAIATQPVPLSMAVTATITLLNGEPIKLQLPPDAFEELLKALGQQNSPSTHS